MLTNNKNIFYVYQIGNSNTFVRITKKMNLKKVKGLDTCAHWDNKAAALTWIKTIEYNFPEAKLVKAKLTLV